jgi:hypothetical protein
MPSCLWMWSGLDTADDGGGMGPEGIRQCMSLGYSRKNTNTTIGQCKWVSFSFVSYIRWRTNDARICTQKILIKCTQKILIKCIQENTDLLYSEKYGSHVFKS